jgi:molybdopterin converting factor small subunit
MATLRLFANLRESAGTASVDLPGTTVAEVVGSAVAEYGDDFARGLAVAKVWVNGEPAGEETPVADGDEIALIPPVSGGATTVPQPNELFHAGLVLALLVAVVVGNIVSAEVLVLAVIGVGLAWLWDLQDVLANRGIRLEIIPSMVAVALAANGAYRWGTPGYAAGVALGVAGIMIWAVLDTRMRSLDTVSASVLFGSIASLAAGGLVLVRLRDTGELSLFLVIAAGAGLAAWATGRFAPNMAGIDPNLAALVGALFLGLVVGLATDVLELPTVLIAAALAGGGLIAGRTLGSVIRTGTVVHTERAPGLLTMFDGPLVAAGLFWIAVAIFT